MLGLCLRFSPACQFLTVQSQKVHIVQVQHRKAAIACHVRYDAACKREQQARAFDQQKGMHLVFGYALDHENPGIFQLHQKQRLAAGFVARCNLELADNLVLVVCRSLARIQRHLHLNIRGDFAALQSALRNRIFKRQIAHILCQNLHLYLWCRLLRYRAIASLSHRQLLKDEPDLAVF